MRTYLDDAHVALLRYVHDRRDTPQTAIPLLVEQGMATQSEVSRLLGRLAELGLIRVELDGATPVPSLTEGGRMYLHQHFDDIRRA